MKRKAGILLPVTALVSQYGIGDFGRNADTFIDFIASIGFKVWQVLPITTIGLGDSPYSGYSAFAGEFTLIDLESVPNLCQDEINSAKYDGSIYRVNYQFAKENKKRLLRLSHSRIDQKLKDEVDKFKSENDYWLIDYALYSALKEQNDYKSFMEWDDCFKLREQSALVEFYNLNKSLVEYFFYEQYLFFKQWKALKEKANKRGVEIFGDIPIYVCHDSVDVWSNAHLFMLDKELKPTLVAGVPPDYFAKDGQLWGNPLYNYTKMSKDGYDWFIKRIKHNLYLYDMLRIDHFRGFWQYWAVDAKAKTAREGVWKNGPKMRIWNALKKVIPNPNIVAEDLGQIDENVHNYLKKTGFPGMRVFQFAFDGDKDNIHLPYNYDVNSVAYTATHDNNTTLGWLYELDPKTRDDVLSYISVGEGWGMGGGKAKAVMAIIKEAISSSSKLAIIPLQDLCGYGGDTRTNIPGLPNGNWQFRATNLAFDEIDSAFISELLVKYGRA